MYSMGLAVLNTCHVMICQWKRTSRHTNQIISSELTVYARSSAVTRVSHHTHITLICGYSLMTLSSNNERPGMLDLWSLRTNWRAYWHTPYVHTIYTSYKLVAFVSHSTSRSTSVVHKQIVWITCYIHECIFHFLRVIAHNATYRSYTIDISLTTVHIHVPLYNCIITAANIFDAIVGPVI